MGGMGEGGVMTGWGFRDVMEVEVGCVCVVINGLRSG